MKIFIELWKAKDAWKQLSLSERQEYVAQIGPVMENLIKKGVVIEAWGINKMKLLSPLNTTILQLLNCPARSFWPNLKPS